MNWFEKFINQITLALSTGYGWLIAIITAFITFIKPEMWTFTIVGVLVLIDLIWGIGAALKLKKSFLSKAFRETLKKAAIYFTSLLVVYITEMIAHKEGSFIAVKMVGVIIAVCEVWSISASMLIVKPNTPFLKLFRKQLLGEIQSKMGKNINMDEIEKIFEESEERNYNNE